MIRIIWFFIDLIGMYHRWLQVDRRRLPDIVFSMAVVSSMVYFFLNPFRRYLDDCFDDDEGHQIFSFDYMDLIAQ